MQAAWNMPNVRDIHKQPCFMPYWGTCRLLFRHSKSSLHFLADNPSRIMGRICTPHVRKWLAKSQQIGYLGTVLIPNF